MTNTRRTMFVVFVALALIAGWFVRAQGTYTVRLWTQDYTFASVDELKTWVAAYHPFVATIGSDQQAFDTLADLKAYVASAQEAPPPPPPPPPPSEFPVWPTVEEATAIWNQQLAPAGSMDCTGYPERRNRFSAQWHDAQGGALEDARHMHIEGCFPETVAGIFRVDLLFVTKDWGPEGTLVGLRAGDRYIRGAAEVPFVMPAPYRIDQQGIVNVPLTNDRIQTFRFSAWYDTSVALTDGMKLIEIALAIARTDGFSHSIRLQVPVLFANGGGREIVHTGAGYYAAEGWMANDVINPFGYLRISAKNFPTRTHRFVGDPGTSHVMRGGGTFAHGLRLSAYYNPDLHALPPSFGTELTPPTRIAGDKDDVVAPFPADFTAGDRIMLRSTDESNPSGFGSAATILTITEGSGV